MEPMNQLVSSMLSLPWDLSRTGLRWCSQIVDGAAPAWQPDLGWIELRNRLEAFQTFRMAGSPSRGAAGGADTLRADLGEVLRRPGGERLWAAEGVGYHHAEAACRRGGEDGLMAAAQPLPPELLLPVHSGVGLSLAIRTLAKTGRRRDEASLLGRFVSRACRQSLPGWEGAVLEALGMAARMLHPERVASLGRSLRCLGDGPASFFWHGVGRALYFAPTQALPWGSAARRAAGKATEEAPGEAERAQALAGVAWAVTLVNLKDPVVLEGLLAAPEASTGPPEALEHGVAAALLVWARGVGREGVLQGLLGHRPRRPGAAEAWERRVRAPATALLAELDRGLGSGAWGELFRQRPLAEVPRALRGGTGR